MFQDPSFTSFHALILLLALFFWQTSPTPSASLAVQNINNQGYLSIDSNPWECLTNLVLRQCLKHLIYVCKCKHQTRAEDIVISRWASHGSEKQLAKRLFSSHLWLCPRHELEKCKYKEGSATWCFCKAKTSCLCIWMQGRNVIFVPLWWTGEWLERQLPSWLL
jgi:hypothetical protein